MKHGTDDKALLIKAVNIQIYAACIDFAFLELIPCLIKEGVYKGYVKHTTKLLQSNVSKVVTRSFAIFDGLDSSVCDGHNHRSWKVFTDITNAIKGGGSKKWFDIIGCLSHIIELHNNELINSYYSPHIVNLYNLGGKLSFLGHSQFDTELCDIITSIDCNIDVRVKYITNN